MTYVVKSATTNRFNLRSVSQNNNLVASFSAPAGNTTVTSIISSRYKLNVVNQNGSLLIAPATVPTITTEAISDLSLYSNTQAMLANDATTYANVIAYIANNYVNSNSLSVSSLNDVDVMMPISNNSTLVYNTTNSKYVVKQMDLDGGNF